MSARPRRHQRRAHCLPLIYKNVHKSVVLIESVLRRFVQYHHLMDRRSSESVREMPCHPEQCSIMFDIYYPGKDSSQEIGISNVLKP